LKFRNLLVVTAAVLTVAGCGTASQPSQGQSSPGVNASAPPAGSGGQSAAPAAPDPTPPADNPACQLLTVEQMHTALGGPIAKFDGSEHKPGAATCYWLSAQGPGRFLILGCPAADSPAYQTLMSTAVPLTIPGVPQAYSSKGKGTQIFAPTPNGRPTPMVPNGPEFRRCAGVNVGIVWRP